MKRIWIHKSTSFRRAEDFDIDYYMGLSCKERLDIMQYLREISYKLKGRKNAHRKGLRGPIKIIQQT